MDTPRRIIKRDTAYVERYGMTLGKKEMVMGSERPKPSPNSGGQRPNEGTTGTSRGGNPATPPPPPPKKSK